MKKLFKTLFWLLVVYTAITIELASIKQVVIECILLIVLTFPVFFYDDIKKNINNENSN